MPKFDLQFTSVRIDTKFITEAMAQKLAKQELAITAGKCVERNLAGKDADGGALPAYKPSYKKAIENAVHPHTFKSGKRKGETVLRGKKATELTLAEKDGVFFRQRTKSNRTRLLAKKQGNTNTNIRLTGDLHDAYGASGSAKAIAWGAELRLPAAEATKLGYLETMGFTNLLAIGKEDEERINASFEKLVGEATNNLITLKK